MSKNHKYQDDIEQKCLDFVKNYMNEKDCFGLFNEQYVELKKWLSKAKPNPNSNKFPDFVFNDGFIEHFAVTSSLENKRGANQKRESMIFKKNSETNFLSNLDNFGENTLSSYSYSRRFEEHTYCNIVNSIKKNWRKHIESYDKNISTSKHGIFLIEYTDINIQTAVPRENDSPEIFDTYRISVDRDMLNCIYTYKEKIDYLIFVNILSLSIEVIRIDAIPKIIEKIPETVYYAPVIGFENHKYSGIKKTLKD